jgi:hypothetical protein
VWEGRSREAPPYPDFERRSPPPRLRHRSGPQIFRTDSDRRWPNNFLSAEGQVSNAFAKIEAPITALPPFCKIGIIAERSRASATLYFINCSPLAKAA